MDSDEDSFSSWSSVIVTYASFMSVGTSTGFCLSNALWNLISNEKLNLPADGNTLAAEFSSIQGVVGITSGVLYFSFLLFNKRGLSMLAEQRGTLALILANIAGILLVGFCWDAAPPLYPVLLTGAAISNIVGNLTFYILFPCISTNYGGWLIAPVRAGTDFSQLVLALLGKLQYIDGKHVRFSERTMFILFTFIACIGLMAWLIILRFDIGRRKKGLGHREQDAFGRKSSDFRAAESLGPESMTDDDSDEDQDSEGLPNEFDSDADLLSSLEVVTKKSSVSEHLIGLACPRSLVLPVIVGSLSQICQWSFAAPLGFVASSQTDPLGCGGELGASVNRQAQTLSCVFLPVASVLSSLAPCPRWLYVPLAAVQVLVTAVVVLVACGVHPEFWQTNGGQTIFISCFSVVAGLEGYLLTMAYRYIGDAEDIRIELRQSSSRLLSLAGVLVVNPITIVVGALILNGTIGCS